MLKGTGERREAKPRILGAPQTVRLFRALSQRDPETFRPSLASSLFNLGEILDKQRAFEEAPAAVQEG